MDPPEEARLVNGAWSWRPALPPQREIVLRRSGATADWRVCGPSGCRAMAADVPAVLPTPDNTPPAAGKVKVPS